MSRVKAEFNHKICAERYDVIGNIRHTRYVCTLFWALFITATWILFCTFILFIYFSLKEYRIGDKNRVGRVTGNSLFLWLKR